jgi:hypothetical protein
MRFLADENVPIGVVEELTAGSHEVEYVARLSPGVLGPAPLQAPTLP